MKNKNLLDQLIHDLRHGKMKSELEKLKPMRVWSKGIHGNPIIVLMAFHTFPPPIHEFASNLTFVYGYLLLNATRLGISTENMAQLTLLYSTGTTPKPSWIGLWINYTNPLVVNSNSRAKVLVCRHDIEQLLLTIYDDIPKSKWTADDRTALRRPLKSTSHTPAQIMAVAPDLELADLIPSGIKIHLSNPLTPDTDEMPEYNHVDLEIYVGLPGLDPAKLEYTHLADVTRALFLIGFNPDQSSLTAYIRGVYVNTTGKRSTFYSKVLVQIIP